MTSRRLTGTSVAVQALWLAALFSTGCSSTPYYPLRAPNPTEATAGGEEGVSRSFESMVAADGTELFAQCWAPPTTPRGLLIVVHGIKDHSSRYAELSSRVVRETGFTVCAMDHRGHGRSAGHRASVVSFDLYLDDLDAFVRRSRERVGAGLPVFLFGHSMGGALSVLLVTERDLDVAGVVLSAPALRVERHPLEIASTGVLAAILPDAPVVASDDALFSRDPEVVRAMGVDPLIYGVPHPARFGGAFLDGIVRVWARASDFDVPLLVLHGTGDRLTDPRGSAEFVAHAGSPAATLRLYRGLYHDLVHEPERAEVIGDIVAFLGAHVTPGTTAAAPEAAAREARGRDE